MSCPLLKFELLVEEIMPLKSIQNLVSTGKVARTMHHGGGAQGSREPKQRSKNPLVLEPQANNSSAFPLFSPFENRSNFVSFNFFPQIKDSLVIGDKKRLTQNKDK